VKAQAEAKENDMQFWRCKCGKSTAFGSDAPFQCEVCDECGSTYASHPDFHAEPIEHDFIIRYNEKTGKPYKICKRCHTKKLIEEA